MTHTDDLSHGSVTVNRVRIAFAEVGEGPAIIFCHGFPELWYSWRHQLPALAQAGYRAIALDMRGHGKSDAPEAIEDYSVLHTVGDVIGVMDALQLDDAILVGHDAGTTTVYNAALMRPDRVRGVVGLSVPYIPRGPRSLLEDFEGRVPPGFYMLYFQPPGQAEAHLDSDPRETIRRMIYANSGEVGPGGPAMMIVPEGGTLFDTLAEPDGPMSFLTEDDLNYYAAEYRRTGFRGGLNGYRVFHRNWELTAPWAGMPLPVPAGFVAGSLDPVMHFPGFREAGEAMADGSERGTALILDGAGHFIQMERPDEVSRAIVEFVARLDR